MNNRLLPILALSTLMLSACAADAELVTLEEYMMSADELADEMVEMGTKFETLMNVQGNALSWSAAEKVELGAVHESLVNMESDAEAMVAPAILADVHPLLIESIQKMRMAVEGVMDIAENPAAATDAQLTAIEQHATEGEALGTQYAEDMEAAITAAYPEMMEE